MTRFYFTRQIPVLALGLSLCSASSCADIYRSQGPDGVMRYASQPLDSSYTLYLLDADAAPAVTIPKSHATNRHNRGVALDPLIRQLAQKHAVDVALIRAIIDVESGFDSNATSPKGAMGLMQLMPATAARYGVTDRSDAAQNLEAGIRYLKDLLKLHDGNVALALASYNAGERAVARHGKRIPPYKETMLYVPAVLARLQTTHP